MDIETLSKQMIDAVKGYVSRAVDTIMPRLDALDAKTKTLENDLSEIPMKVENVDYERIGNAIKEVVAVAVSELPKAKDGASVTMEDVEPLIEEKVKAAISQIPKPVDGKDADPEFIKNEVQKAVSLIPKPADGKSLTIGDVKPLLSELVKSEVSQIPKPKDGENADPEFIRDEVQRAVSQIPKAVDGKSITVEDVTPLIVEKVKAEVSQIPRPKDGESIHPDTVARMVAEHVAAEIVKIPKAKDGLDAARIAPLESIDETRSYPAGTWARYCGGLIKADRATDPVTDGIEKAGWSVMIEGISAVVISQGDDERSVCVAAMLTSGTKAISEFSIPMMIYREVWKPGEFKRGDVVTWAGSSWHCQVDKTMAKPGESPDWKLMVKSGRDGRDLRVEDVKKGENIVRLK